MSVIITKYNTSSGIIISTLTLPSEDDISLNIMASENYIIGDFPNSHYRVVGGSPHYKSQDEINTLKHSKDLRRLRSRRDKLLSMSDWTQASDNSLSHTKRQEWATYRQALRDLPSEPSLDPADPSWPAEPTTT